MQATIEAIESSPTPLGAHILPPPSSVPAAAYLATNEIRPRTTYELQINFTQEQLSPSDFNRSSDQSAIPQSQLKHLINEKFKKKEFFYGLEITARAYTPNTILDYRKFQPLLPLFTSIVWLGLDYSNIEMLPNVESLQIAEKLHTNLLPVMPHFSCYNLNRKRLEEFLNLNYSSNIFVVRGDQLFKDQQYVYSAQLVEDIRKIKGDSITIGVAGYPEGHPECNSLEEDVDNLVKKVNSGADFIITQICFSTKSVADFIKLCRLKGIRIPILIGIYIPNSLQALKNILHMTNVQMPPEDYQEYQQHSEKGSKYFHDFAVSKSTAMMQSLMDNHDLEVYGFQLFTMNQFRNVQKVLEELRK